MVVFVYSTVPRADVLAGMDFVENDNRGNYRGICLVCRGLAGFVVFLFRDRFLVVPITFSSSAPGKSSLSASIDAPNPSEHIYIYIYIYMSHMYTVSCIRVGHMVDWSIIHICACAYSCSRAPPHVNVNLFIFGVQGDRSLRENCGSTFDADMD